MEPKRRAAVKTNVGSGDRGMTSLLSGERVPKSHARVEACGEVDELVSVLGACAAALPPDQAELCREIQAIQGDLLLAGAWLATSIGSPTLAMLRVLGPDRTRALEDGIDRLEAELPPLQSFILPGGHSTAAWAHVARTVCRRAERRVQILMADGGEETSTGTQGILAYLNRLSTYLFALARYCNKLHGVPDLAWKG
jgi:cob(I)alamin adenosyltransferase